MSRLSRRSFLAASSATTLYSQAAQPPNILLILADDLGYGDLSCYGGKDIQTPNIDELAAAGMGFENFYANSPVCSPTRAALMTGVYPDCAGVPGVIRTAPENSWGYLSQKRTLLPVKLKETGYHTAIIGKWHLGLDSPNTPPERGFDFFHGFLGDMMDDYYSHRRHGNNYMRRNAEVIDPKGHATDLFTDWAIEYLNERKSAGRPFFLYLPYNAPHTPIQPPENWLAKVRQRHPGMPEKRAKLVALVEHLDDAVGRVVKELKKNGQYENTLIIFTSDNGGQLDAGGTAGPWRGGKQDMYEGGIRVPMCAVWPGRIKAGSRSGAVALSMDLYPTLCEAAGVRRPGDIDGLSILPVLRGEAQSLPQRDLVWVRREGGTRYRGREYYALRRGRWKLLQNHPFEPYQLYNLQDDPGETRDLSGERAEIYRELWMSLSRHVQRAARTPWQA